MISPSVAHTRARVASASRDVARGVAPQSKLDDALRDHAKACAAADLDRHLDYVKSVVDAATPLSDEQRTKLAELLRPARKHIAAQRLAETGGAVSS